MHDFSRLHPDMSLKTLDADSVEGVHKLEVYGLYQTPALAVTRSSSGDVIKIWSGDSLPLMDEVAGYMRS